jgi:hypothetical protein
VGRLALLRKRGRVAVLRRIHVQLFPVPGVLWLRLLKTEALSPALDERSQDEDQRGCFVDDAEEAPDARDGMLGARELDLGEREFGR